MENTSNQETNLSTAVKQRSKRCPTQCKICGALALYSNFGVVVCPSCKMFFKRNAQKKQGQLKCIYHGHCEININNRHICTVCRLKKCFASGMQVEMFRALRTAKKNTSQKTPVTTRSTILATHKENDQLQQLLTLNRLQPDQSILSIDEWNLLSNLTHCYDEYNGFSLARRFIQKQNQLPPKMRFKLAPVGQFFTSITSAGQLLYEKNVDFISLCSHDRSILLHSSIKYVAGLGTCFITRYTRVLDYPAFCKSAEVIYGSDTLDNNNYTIDLLGSDGTFVKLVLALLTFSTLGSTDYTNTTPVNLLNFKAVVRIQNMYSTLTWRYLVYRHGYDRAVICFSNLIKCIFSVNTAVVKAVKVKLYRDMINVVLKQTEETFTLTE